MSFDYKIFLEKLTQIKLEVTRQSKRAIKKETPKTVQVRTDIRDNLVQYFNEFTKAVVESWKFLDNTQKSNTKEIFHSIRDKVVRAFQALEVRYKVPISCIENIDPLIVEEDILDLEDKESDSNITTMNAAEFFNLASKLLPNQFDGNPDNLTSFIDSLELIKLNAENQQDNAIAFVKTRLTGKARDLINNENSIDAIILTLKNHLKGESSSLASSKLLHLKQNNKDATNFAKEVEILSEKLQKAYISEGVPYDVAKNYTVETTVRALSQNASSPKARLIIEAGTFSSVPEILTKLVNVTSNPSEPNVLYLHHNRNSFNTRQHFRGRGFQNYNTRGQFNRGRRGRANYNNNNRNFNRGRGRNPNNGYVRFCHESEQGPGNELDPQRSRLGEM